MRRAYVAPASRVHANAVAFSLPPKSAESVIAVASGAVAGVEYVRVWPAAPATDTDTPTSRKTATVVASFRTVPLTARRLSAVRAGGGQDLRTTYISLGRPRAGGGSVAPR